MIVGTELRDERELEQARQLIVEHFGRHVRSRRGAKLDINNTSQQAMVDRLRGPLADQRRQSERTTAAGTGGEYSQVSQYSASVRASSAISISSTVSLV